MSMKPAAMMVATKCRAGAWPTALELGAMLYEANCDQAEARDLVGRYRDAIAGGASHEDELMAQLRAFSLRTQ